MQISYNKLWKLLIDRNMKKGQLIDAVGSSRSAFAKMGRNEPVSLSLLLRICHYFGCDFGDIIEAVLDEKE